MEKEEAQKGVVKLLHDAAPNLKDYVLEQWRNREELETKRCAHTILGNMLC